VAVVAALELQKALEAKILVKTLAILLMVLMVD
jgi:hypothetical protein